MFFIQRGTAIVDVGFGSMQAFLFDKDALVSTQNLPLGVLRLRELIAHEKLSQQGAQNLIAELIDNELVTYRKMYLKDREIKNLIAIGEPILSLYYKMAEGKHSEQISIQEFNRFYERLKSMTLAQTEDFFDVNEEYASLMFPAAAIYKRMLEITGAEFIWVPGIRMTDGMAAEYAEDKKLIRFNHSFENDIIVTSRNMAKRYKCYMPHIQNVEEAALKVFDSLKKYHGLGPRERLLLQIAANLHSCGKFVTMRGADECAYNMIMATEIIGLSHVEREIVANIVKYHQQKFRYNEVRVSAKPSKDSRLVSTEDLSIVIAKLTAILRLANSMDRGHTGKLKDCRLNVKDSTKAAALWTLKTVLINSLKLLHPYMPFITEEIFCNLQDEEASIMVSAWPEYKTEWNFEQEEYAVETIKEAVRAIRNVRTSMNVAPSKKAKVYVVSENQKLLQIFEHSKVFFATLGYASEVFLQSDKQGIADDAVSVVIPEASIYIPFAELVDIAKEIERLQKEEERLTRELARVTGMLSNEKFVSKAPEAKINEEKAKLEKYTQMMEQVKARLAQLK